MYTFKYINKNYKFICGLTWKLSRSAQQIRAVDFQAARLFSNINEILIGVMQGYTTITLFTLWQLHLLQAGVH